MKLTKENCELLIVGKWISKDNVEYTFGDIDPEPQIEDARTLKIWDDSANDSYYAQYAIAKSGESCRLIIENISQGKHSEYTIIKLDYEVSPELILSDAHGKQTAYQRIL